MRDDDGHRPSRQRRFESLRGQQERQRVDIREAHGQSPPSRWPSRRSTLRSRRSRPRRRRGVERSQRELERIRSAGDSNTVRNAKICGELGLEGVVLGAEDIATALEHARDRSVELASLRGDGSSGSATGINEPTRRSAGIPRSRECSPPGRTATRRGRREPRPTSSGTACSRRAAAREAPPSDR